MIFTILLVIYLVFIVCAIRVLAPVIAGKKRTSECPMGEELVGIFIVYTTTIAVLIPIFCGVVGEANAIKSKIVLMKPLDQFRKDIAINEKELAKVQRLIERAFDKNNPNVSVKLENGVKIYSLLGSSDLGSAEAGNAEKQKLLLNYIEKQNEIADRLIYINKLAYGDDYYRLQQEYAVYANGVFFGWLTKRLTVDTNYKPVRNINYYPSE